MPPSRKKATPPPIDRPLSKAYLRGFKGWSTAYPPGLSDPATVRIMENVKVGRNGALCVRPGLRYLTYTSCPDTDPQVPGNQGIAPAFDAIGSQELFYLDDGNRAILYAVREASGMVGFRVMLFHYTAKATYLLTDPEVGFNIPQGVDTLEFSEETTYVRYLQINNRILALSDTGEPARMFYVGAGKWAKQLAAVTVPAWEDTHKPEVIHPQVSWIEEKASQVDYNLISNSTFEAGTRYWNCDPTGKLSITSFYGAPGGDGNVLDVVSLPTRRNYAISPLVNLGTYGTEGWAPHAQWPCDTPTIDSGALRFSTSTESLFYVSSSRYPNIKSGERYVIAVDVVDTSINPEVLVDFQAVDGVTVDSVMRLPLELTAGRYVSPAITAPPSAVSMKLSFGGSAPAGGGWVKLANLMVVVEGESTTQFTGASGTHYFWETVPNVSQSVYHPPVDVEAWTDKFECFPGEPMTCLVSASGTSSIPVTLRQRRYSKDGVLNATTTATPVSVTGSWSTLHVTTTPPLLPGAVVEATSVKCEFVVSASLARGETLTLNNALATVAVWDTPYPTYFDGSFHDTSTVRYGWSDPLHPHECSSVMTKINGTAPTLAAVSPRATETLISSVDATNTYKMGFFYTFENEVGESTPSKITEVRMMRAWSDWKWEEPKADGSPDPAAPTKTAERCADQLVVQIPEAVYNQAVDEGALAWNLYAMSWSESEAVPVTGLLVNSRPLRASLELSTDTTLAYDEGSWLAVTPARKVADAELGLPSRTNRVNYSEPPRHRSGLVAGDRMILVGDPNDLASIQWSSNRPAESTNFSVSKGGGRKTLTSGNLNIPADVVLWQNPQSVDTITVLCMGDDGRSVTYYMAPATVNQGQSGVVRGMGFEQVSGTPGTSSPYGALVANNALFRPLDQALLKTTANNYNISHKTQSDLIANMWQQLRGLASLVSVQLDNRIYLLVHNPQGELLKPNCRGNEIWVYDIAGDTGTWSRYLIQANSLNVFSVRNRARVIVGSTKGLYYLDDDAFVDDVPEEDGALVEQRPIPWYFETNTQGASRAHDAWAHLQGVLLTMGSFHGSMRYGVRGHTVNGIRHEIEKEFSYSRPLDFMLPEWDVEDQLLVRRDFKEWIFFAGSTGDAPSSGEICSVQYRYTPVSVNVGYEFGSVETFEYGSRVSNAYAENGIPLPYMDYSQP